MSTHEMMVTWCGLVGVRQRSSCVMKYGEVNIAVTLEVMILIDIEWYRRGARRSQMLAM